MMAAQAEVNRLRRRLMTLEMTLKELLSIDRPTSILKEKLTQAESLVVELPEEERYIVTEWRGKLASWYKDYCLLLVSVVEGGHGTLAKAHLPVPSTSRAAQPPTDPNDLVQANSSNEPPQSQQQQQNWGPTEDPAELDHFTGGKVAIERQLLHAISQLPRLDSFDDLPNLKKLAQLVAKADELLDPYWRDQMLQKTLMDALKEKVPPAKWDEFSGYVGDAWLTMRNLKRFIIRQMRAIYDDLKSRGEAEQRAAAEAIGDGGDGSFCNYCKLAGHYVDSCASIRYTLCFNCLEDGHRQARCTKTTRVSGGQW